MKTQSSLLSARSIRPASRVLVGVLRAIVVLLLAPGLSTADDSKLSTAQRQQIIREFLAEHPFVHRALPRGKAGVRIEGDKITPSQAELSQIVDQFGVAAKPGDRARITAIHFVHHAIVFEINGGPVKRKSWRDRVSVGMGGADPTQNPQPQAQPSDQDIYTASSGSSVTLVLKDEAASLTTAQVKELLAPVLDFNSMTVAEAYQKSLPPRLAEAVKDHHALVGMDKDMVTYALGRPPQRVRENKDGKDYEEWIYGTPPQDVEFIRFLNDRVVSIEDMKVTGEKRVRTQDEVGYIGGVLDAAAEKHTRPDAAAAATSAQPGEERRSAPTLLRPGEKPVQSSDDARDPNPAPPPDSPTAPTAPGPN